MILVQYLFVTCLPLLVSATILLPSNFAKTVAPVGQTESIAAHTIERRAAFDIGSGQIKMQVSDVDVTANKILNVLIADNARVGLREDIAKSLDGRLSPDMQNKTVDAIKGLMHKCAPFHPDSYHAVATESLRLAKNNEVLIERIKKDTGLSVTIISQEDEGILGFISATSEADVDLNKAIVWDLGGGSTQMTTTDGDHYCIYQGKIGSVPLKHSLLKIQGKDVATMGTPNPISESDMEQAIRFIEEKVQEIPNELQQKLNRSDVVVLGIGINPLWGLQQSAHYDKDRVLAELTSRLNLDDEAVGIKDSIQKEYADRRVSNLVLVYGVMKTLNINEVQYVGTPGANAIGLLLSPQYWQTETESKINLGRG